MYSFLARRMHLRGYLRHNCLLISNSVSLNLCLCSSLRSLGHTTSSSCLLCPIGVIIVNRLTGFSFVSCRACETPTTLFTRQSRLGILPTDEGRRTRSDAASTPRGRRSCFVCTPCSWCLNTECPDSTSLLTQNLVLTKSPAHPELGPPLRAEIVDISNVSPTNVVNVFCFPAADERFVSDAVYDSRTSPPMLLFRSLQSRS